MSTWIAAGATFAAAAIALYIGTRATKSAEKTSKAQLYIQIRNIYDSEKMLAGMRLLIEFQENHKKDLEEFFKEKIENNYWEVHKEDAARRRFSHYCATVNRLKRDKHISEDLEKGLMSENTKKFKKTYVDPLEKVIKEDMQKRRAALGEEEQKTKRDKC